MVRNSHISIFNEFEDDVLNAYGMTNDHLPPLEFFVN